MNVLNKNNFADKVGAVHELIQNASFIALDFEFLGLPQLDPDCVPSILDTAEERFIKNLRFVSRYLPCQLGLCIFNELEKGVSYNVYVYRMDLFKEIPASASRMNLKSVAFLHEHNFDFNRWVSEGINYCTSKEITELYVELRAGFVDALVFGEAFKHYLAGIESVVARKISADSDMFNMAVPAVPELKDFELSVDLVQNNCIHKEKCFVGCFWPLPLTDIQSHILLHILTRKHPSAVFRVQSGSKLFIRRVSVDDPDHSTRKKSALENLMHLIAGVSNIVEALVVSKKPLVMHNSYLDLIYLYHHFVANLDGLSYSEAKTKIHDCFPTVIDSKSLALLSAGVLKDRKPDILNKLQTLKRYVDMESDDRPHRDLLFLHEKRLKARDCMHDASCDALITGEVFLKLAHIFCVSLGRLTLSQGSEVEIGRLLELIGPHVNNKVPIPFCRTQFMCLDGQDQPMDFIHQVHLKKTSRYIPLAASDGRKFSDVEIATLRAQLVADGAFWRCDVQLKDANTALICCSSCEVYEKTVSLVLGMPAFRIDYAASFSNVRFVSTTWSLRQYVCCAVTMAASLLVVVALFKRRS